MAVIARALCEELFREAVAACDPEVPVLRWMRSTWSPLHDRPPTLGVAIGKAARKMACGVGAIGRGVIVTNADDAGPVPEGWRMMIASHPEPDERSLAAGDAVVELIQSATPGDRVIALISGGASALCERLVPGATLEQLRAEIQGLVARGRDIQTINTRRKKRSAIKGGKLAALCQAPIVTLAISDVIGDDLATIGSGPTISDRPGDRAELIEPMTQFADVVAARAHAHGLELARRRAPMMRSVAEVADELAARGRSIAWGEPTLQLPADHGEGGRAQQLALELARRFRGGARSAFVAGSDGIDGPPPQARPAPAGAYVDGATWDAIVAAGIDPAAALARCDAGTVLDAVGALVVTGPTGINHADVAIVG